MTKKPTIGDIIAEARRAANITQQALADRVETSRVTIARYEIDAETPSLPALQRIVSALGIDPEAMATAIFPESRKKKTSK